MPQTKQAKKALRQAEKRRLRNLKVKREIKFLLKKTRKAIDQKKTRGLLEQIRELEKKIDKAVQKGVFHKNKGARLKSRLWQRVKKAGLKLLSEKTGRKTKKKK